MDALHRPDGNGFGSPASSSGAGVGGGAFGNGGRLYYLRGRMRGGARTVEAKDFGA